MLYRGRTYLILPFLLCSYCTHTGDPATVGLLTRVMQYATPVMYGIAGSLGLKWHQHQTLSQDRIDMIKLPQNIDVLTKEAGGKVVVPPTSQPTVEVIAPTTPQATVEIIAPQPQPKSTAGIIVGGVDAHKQFLQPGEQQPQFYNPGTSDQPYTNRPGTLGHQTTVGDTNVSVGTDSGSILNLIKDVGNVLSNDSDRPKASEIATAAKEKELRTTLKNAEQQFKEDYKFASEDQVRERKAQIIQERTQLVNKSVALHGKSDDKHYSKAERKRAWQEAGELTDKHRLLSTELNVINEHVRYFDVKKQVIHTGASSLVTITQTAPVTKTETVLPILTDSRKTAAVGEILADLHKPGNPPVMLDPEVQRLQSFVANYDKPAPSFTTQVVDNVRAYPKIS